MSGHNIAITMGSVAHEHGRVIAATADTAAVGGIIVSLWQQGPILAAWISAAWFIGRMIVAWVKWARRRKGNCPTCGDH